VADRDRHGRAAQRAGRGVLGAIGLAADPAQVTQAGQVVQNPGAAQTAGIVGAIVALAVLFVAYYCGGYVAGRMARFSGAKQGVACGSGP
jgi:hypothetical protein